MIIKSSQRGGTKSLADHLTKEIDDDGIQQKVIVSGSRNLLIRDDVHEGLDDMKMMSWASPNTRKHLYHITINPDQDLDQKQWQSAWKAYEEEYGLQDHAYMEVTHIKKGRTHRHRVYERVDTNGKAIKLSYTKIRNEKVARILEHKFGHQLTIGKHNRAVISRLKEEGRENIATWMEQGRAHEAKRPVAKIDHQEIQQQRRTKISKKEVKEILQQAYVTTKNGQEFEQAIITKNLVLAKGDRRDFVVVDAKGGTHSPRRMLGVKVAELRKRWSDLTPQHLPTVEQVKQERNPQKIPKVDKSNPEQALHILQEAKAKTEQEIARLEEQLNSHAVISHAVTSEKSGTSGQDAVKKLGRETEDVSQVRKKDDLTRELVEQTWEAGKSSPEKSPIDPSEKPSSSKEEDFDQRRLIEQLQHWQNMAERERRSAPGSPEKVLGQERFQNKNYGMFFPTTKPPANENVKPQTESPDLKIGELDPELVAALKQAALNSPNSYKQISRAHWLRAHPSQETTDWWQQRGGYHGTAKREYLKELSRQAEQHGTEAVLTPRIDLDIAVRLRGAGFSWKQIHTTVNSESPIATSLSSTEQKSAYLEKVVKPTLQAKAVQELRESVNRDKRERGIEYEQRLDKLGLASQVSREVNQKRDVGLER